jgi:hypothetical protein
MCSALAAEKYVHTRIAPFLVPACMVSGIDFDSCYGQFMGASAVVFEAGWK